jgi:hypothetical protein
MGISINESREDIRALQLPLRPPLCHLFRDDVGCLQVVQSVVQFGPGALAASLMPSRPGLTADISQYVLRRYKPSSQDRSEQHQGAT